MPEKSQMKMQFLEIDGRTVPIVYPQHGDGDDGWDVTGKDNPLPTANYVQNDSGLWVPVSKNNPVPTQLTGSTVPEEVLVDDEPLFAGSMITTSEFSTKNANEIRFVLTCSDNIFDDLDVLFLDTALDGGFSRYTIEDVRGETRYKTFVAKPASKACRVRMSAEGDQDINVTLQAFYYYYS